MQTRRRDHSPRHLARRRSSLPGRLLVSLATSLAGCFGAPELEGLDCSQNAPCPAPYACGDDLLCHRHCGKPGDCTAEEACVQGACREATSADRAPEASPRATVPADAELSVAVCRLGALEICYGGSPETISLGRCHTGVRACSASGWGACVGEELPGFETCNGLDDDCNGVIDDDFTELTTKTCGVGACQRDVVSCETGRELTCTPGEPAPEICNGIDDDCDGVVDEEVAAPGLDSVFPACADGACIGLIGRGFSADASIELRTTFAPRGLVATLTATLALHRPDGSEHLLVELKEPYLRQLLRTSGLGVRIVDRCPGALSAEVTVKDELDLSWSPRGPIASRSCVQILETSDPDTWNDNYLCSLQSYGFKWSAKGAIAGMSCVAWLETSDPHTWDDNYLCTPKPIGQRWSFRGPIAGARCIQIVELSDPDTWTDNYLCF